MISKVRFTFKQPYRFRCLENCGMCCYQRGLLLTNNDYERIRKISNVKIEVNPTIASGFNVEMKLKEDKCPYLQGSRCSIYEGRPVICRIYPLTIAFSPNCELFVNLMHCPGVGFSKGRLVNVQMVEETFGEIESIDPHFLERKRKKETATFPQEYLNMKCLIYRKIGEWISCNVLKGQGIEIKGESLARAFLAASGNKELGNLSILTPQLSETISKIEEKVMKKLASSLKLTIRRHKKQLKKTFKKNRATLTLDERQMTVSLNQHVNFYDLYGRIIKVMPSELLKEKETSEAAERLLEEHLQEILARVGSGGVPIDSYLVEAMESIRRYCQMLDTYLRVYSLGEREIGEEAAGLAITNLDTKMAFTSMCKTVHNFCQEAT